MVIPLLQAFSSVIFRICVASRGPSASAELLVDRNIWCEIYRWIWNWLVI